MKRGKAGRERQVFNAFVVAADLGVNRRSIRSTQPPYPDVSCRVDGVPQYFELTRMVHQGSANEMGRHLSRLSRKGSDPGPGVDSYDDRAALRETITRKASKTYETRGRPSSLLIFVDGVLHPPKMPPVWARSVLQDEGPRSHWSAIWVYDAASDRIITSWRRESTAAPHANGADAPDRLLR